SRLIAANADAILAFSGVVQAKCEGLVFTAQGDARGRATAIKQTDLHAYANRLSITNCYFYGDLGECIVLNPIYTSIEGSVFGLYGNVAGYHRHIYCPGPATGLTPNLNRISRNRFYWSTGAESIRFENGHLLRLRENNFEYNGNATIDKPGVFHPTL